MKRIRYTAILLSLLAILCVCVCSFAIAEAQVDATRYFYNQLDDFEKELYETILNTPIDDLWVELPHSAELAKEMTLEQLREHCYNAFGAVKEDNPICDARWNYFYVDEYPFKLTPTVGYSQEIEDTVFATLQSMQSIIGEGHDRYTFVRRLCDYIGKNIEYDPYSAFTTDFSSQKSVEYNGTLLGPILTEATVCDGYAHFTKAVCDDAGIPCIVAGNAGHAWNFIQMEDGQWYSIDMTMFGRDV